MLRISLRGQLSPLLITLSRALGQCYFDFFRCVSAIYRFEALKTLEQLEPKLICVDFTFKLSSLHAISCLCVFLLLLQSPDCAYHN